MKIVDRIALILVIIGALNWGSIGLFRFDCVAAIFGGQLSVWSRIIYTLVGIAGLWCITLLFREDAHAAVFMSYSAAGGSCSVAHSVFASASTFRSCLVVRLASSNRAKRSGRRVMVRL